MGLLSSTVIKVVVILEMFAAVVDRSSVVVVVRWNVYVFVYLVLTDLAVSFYVTGEASTRPPLVLHLFALPEGHSINIVFADNFAQ